MQSLRNLPRPFVFVPMAADLFHYGHINILLKAKKYGTVIVGLMTDKGIKSYKKKKPLIKFSNRKKILMQIKCIDKIIPLNGLQYVQYSKFYKFEYFVREVIGKKCSIERRLELKKIMKKWNGKVLEFPYTKGVSSSKKKNII